MSVTPDAQTLALTDLTRDPKNARTHDDRNLQTIAQSLTDVGAARSIVIDEAGVVLAGNGTVAAAAQAGLTRVRVIDAAGDELIAVRRSNLTPEQKIRLALADNRAAELAAWDTTMLAQLHTEVRDLTALWHDEELQALLATVTPATAPPIADAAPTRSPSEPATDVPGQFLIVLTCRSDSHQRELLERFRADGLACHGETR